MATPESKARNPMTGPGSWRHWPARATLPAALFCLAAGPALLILVPLFGAAGPPSGQEGAGVARLLPEFANTAAVTLVAILTALFLGGPPAWILQRHRLPGATILGALPLCPLLLPAHVTAGLWMEAAGEDISRNPVWLGLILGAASSPYAYLLMRLAWQRLPAGLEEAAATLGLGPGRRMLRLLLPVAAPALLLAALLAAAESISDFGAADRMGVQVISTGIYRYWFGLQSWRAGALLSLPVLTAALVVALPLLIRMALRSGLPARRAGAARPAPAARGPRALALTGVCCLAAAPGFLAPFTLVAAWLPAALGRTNLETLDADLFNSLAAGAGTASLTLAAAALYGWAILRSGRLGTRLVTVALLSLNLLLPALVFALAFLPPGGSAPAWHVRLAATLAETGPLPLMLAMAWRFLPLQIFPLADALARLSPALGDAARTLGRTPSAVARGVILPAVRAPALAGLLLVLIESVQEMTLSLILQPFGWQSLATRIHAYAGLHQTRDATVWIWCLAMVLLPPVWLLARLMANGEKSSA